MNVCELHIARWVDGYSVVHVCTCYTPRFGGEQTEQTMKPTLMSQDNRADLLRLTIPEVDPPGSALGRSL